ncbi:MAG: ArnT family glycosyltransferase [Acidobacteriota bacterium]
MAAFAFLGSPGLLEPTEARYVEAGREMILSSNWLVPTLHNEPHLTKPPLMYWLVAAGFHLLGLNEWGARFFQAVAFLATALVVSLFGSVLWGRRRGRWAGIVYATALGPFLAASVVTPDTLLALAASASLLCFWCGWIAESPRRARAGMMGMWGCLAVAFLAKGPPGLLPLLVILAFVALVRAPGQRARRLRPLSPAGIALFAAIGLPWYIAAMIWHPGLSSYLFGPEFYQRVFTGIHERNEAWYNAFLYVPALIAGMIPWCFLWRWKRLVRSVAAMRSRLRSCPARLFLTLWVAVPTCVLLLARSRMPIYALPILPALALATVPVLPIRSSGPSGAESSAAGRSSLPTPRLLAVWIPLLLITRLAAGVIPTGADARRLAESIRGEVRPGRTEFVVVDMEIYGLGFYLDADIETVRARPPLAPVFWKSKRLSEELEVLATTRLRHIFIGQRFLIRPMMRDLEAAGLPCASRPAPEGLIWVVCDPVRAASGDKRIAVVVDSGMDANERFRLARLVHDLDDRQGLAEVLVAGGGGISKGRWQQILGLDMTGLLWPLAHRQVSVREMGREVRITFEPGASSLGVATGARPVTIVIRDSHGLPRGGGGEEGYETDRGGGSGPVRLVSCEAEGTPDAAGGHPPLRIACSLDDPGDPAARRGAILGKGSILVLHVGAQMVEVSSYTPDRRLRRLARFRWRDGPPALPPAGEGRLEPRR